MLYALLVAANDKPVSPARCVEIIISGSSSAGMSESGLNTFKTIGNRIDVVGMLPMKKGANKFNAPKFVQFQMSKEQLPSEALPFAKNVKEYLSQWDKEEKPVEVSPVDKDFDDALHAPQQRDIYAAPVSDAQPSVFNDDSSFPTLADAPPEVEPENKLPF